jgi:hypothetical protein
MKLTAKFSAWIISAALLAFVPSAFGQTAFSHLNSATLVFQGWGGQGGQGGNGGGGNGCQGGGNGGGGNGWGGQGSGWGGGGQGGNGSGGCNDVPEGGNALTYLALAGACCVGASAIRLRRPALVPASN